MYSWYRDLVNDDKGRMLLVFSESKGTIDSNETEILAIRRAIYLWASHRNGNIIVESHSTNAIGRASR